MLPSLPGRGQTRLRCCTAQRRAACRSPAAEETRLEVDDSYRELGITRDCSDAEVKAAWRRLAAHWHPDRNRSPAALRKIQRINRALEEIRKARRMARHGVSDSDEASAPPADEPAAGNGEAAGAAADSGGLHHIVSLTLEQALAGCQKELQGEVIDDCAACGATGKASQPCVCTSCGGSGQVRQPLWFGWLAAAADCEDCQGQGEIQPACGTCGGSGSAPPRQYRCRVRIPPGMRDGDQLQVQAHARSREAPLGDTLTITIKLLPHPFFSLDDDGTVRCEVPVDGFAWMAERWAEVPTPSGLQQMRMRRGRLVYRIREQGFTARGAATRADCLVTVVPMFPEALSAQQEAQIDQLIASHSGDAATPAGQRVASWKQLLAAWQREWPAHPGRAEKS